ncbi:MAG TPA: CYTH domain-containing protein [Geomonas sp.]|nr:CYTH domain-containing protein [Geomonas sp.]
MAKEIERKFLVKGDDWKGDSQPIHTCQGYLNVGGDCTARVRIQGEKAFLTIKGKTKGISRSEFEYGIPVEDAKEMLVTLCRRPYIEKNRYKVMYAGMEWEVDQFMNENEGLLLAEVELESEDQQVELPPWAGEEVSHDFRYRNVNLIQHPYSEWKK